MITEDRVPNVHSLADGACHTAQTYAELVSELLTYCADTTVAQVVDIVHGSLGVDELNEIFDNLYDVGICKNTGERVDIQTELFVQTVTTYTAQVIPLL